MNQTSIARSDELTLKAQDFLKFKQEYLRSGHDRIFQENKKKIMDSLHAAPEDWNSWHWQMANRYDSADKLNTVFPLTSDQKEQIDRVSASYRWSITPYYLALIESFDPSDPVYAQSIPQSLEMDNWGKADPMAEEDTNPCGSITRRYPDRLIINVTNCCAMFCRHCQRRRNIGGKDDVTPRDKLDDSIRFVKEHPEIRDVLLTGGDPLTLSDDRILDLVRRVRAIPTVETIRIGTRVLVTMPQRFTDAFCRQLSQYAPLYLNTQFNHPNEITPEVREACRGLADNGIVLGNQMVLLRGINDNSHTIRLMNHMLLQCRIRPYYIFHPKEVIGTRHFYVPLREGLDIVDDFRGNTSGLAIPTYIYNAPDGRGKIPIMKNSVRTAEDGTIHLRTWEGIDVPVRE